MDDVAAAAAVAVVVLAVVAETQISQQEHRHLGLPLKFRRQPHRLEVEEEREVAIAAAVAEVTEVTNSLSRRLLPIRNNKTSSSSRTAINEAVVVEVVADGAVAVAVTEREVADVVQEPERQETAINSKKREATRCCLVLKIFFFSCLRRVLASNVTPCVLVTANAVHLHSKL